MRYIKKKTVFSAQGVSRKTTTVYKESKKENHKKIIQGLNKARD
jgi:hypothetical protein